MKKVEIKNDKCNEINKINVLTENIIMPDVDISTWETIFIDLKKRDKFVIIEDEKNDEFVIGVIEDVLKNKVIFKAFDADGNWEEGTWEIPFSSITTLTWNTRYTNNWEEYLLNKK